MGSIRVTPCAGVWIEIAALLQMSASAGVTPCAGVWIEIRGMTVPKAGGYWSLPVRECGLKSFDV